MLDDISLNLLRQSKLNDKQSHVYLAALQLGQASVTEIAALAELKRSTTYLILGQLSERGYINQIPGSKTQAYSATDPTTLASELEQAAHDFKEMLPYLRAQHQKAGKPFVTYYSGLKGLEAAFRTIRKPKEARYAISVKKALRHIPNEISRWKKLYLEDKAGKGGYHLLSSTKEDRSYGDLIARHHQHVRYLPKGAEWDMDFSLVDNRVFMTAFHDDMHVTVLESPTLYKSLRTMFDLAWRGANK